MNRIFKLFSFEKQSTETEEHFWRLKLFVSFAFAVGIVQITLYFYNLILMEPEGLGLHLVLVLGVFLLGIGYWAKRTQKMKYPLIVLLVWLSIHIVFRASTNGGPASPITYWLPIIPALILVTFGAREGWFTFTLVTVAMVLISFMDRSHIAPFELRRAVLLLGIIFIVVALVLIDNRRRNLFAKLIESANSIRISKGQQIKNSQSEVFLNLSKQLRTQMLGPLHDALAITENSILSKDFSDEEKKRLMKLQQALMRISSIHETMQQMENTNLSFIDYTDRSEMLDLSTIIKK